MKKKPLKADVLLRSACMELRASSVALAEVADQLERRILAEDKLAELEPEPPREPGLRMHEGPKRFKGVPGKVAHRAHVRGG